MWFCDYYNRYPEELETGKTYVGMIVEAEWVHGKRWEESGNQTRTFEFCPEPISVTLYTPEGKRIEDPFNMQGYYELTDGFYETEDGQRLLEVADWPLYRNEMQPVVGTNSTDLLIRFVKWWCGLFLIFFKALIDNQLLHTVLKGLIRIFVEMHLDGVSCIPQLPLEAGSLLLVFAFCHILLLYKK